MERSGTRVASANTPFANDDIVLKVRAFTSFLSFLTQVALVLAEVLLSRDSSHDDRRQFS